MPAEFRLLGMEASFYNRAPAATNANDYDPDKKWLFFMKPFASTSSFISRSQLGSQFSHNFVSS